MISRTKNPTTSPLLDLSSWLYVYFSHWYHDYQYQYTCCHCQPPIRKLESMHSHPIPIIFRPVSFIHSSLIVFFNGKPLAMTLGCLWSHATENGSRMHRITAEYWNVSWTGNAVWLFLITKSQLMPKAARSRHKRTQIYQASYTSLSVINLPSDFICVLTFVTITK